MDRITGEARCRMRASVDGGNELGVLQAVEGKGASDRDDMSAIYDAPGEPASLGEALIEMDTGVISAKGAWRDGAPPPRS